MKTRSALVALFLLLAASFAQAQKAKEIPNPSIDMKGFLKLAGEAAEHREKRRLTEEEFIALL